MSKKEINRIPILEKAINNLIKTSQGAKTLGITERHFRRLKKLFQTEGPSIVVHKSRGRESNNRINTQMRDLAMTIIAEKYTDFGPTLAKEKLEENHDIKISVETLRKEMIKNNLWKTKTKRRANIHQMRERRDREGELVQIDGSPHRWFEDRAVECTLLVMIDDATGKLLWLEFTKSESSNSYFKAIKGYLRLHGRPLCFYSDKHSVFRVNTNRAHSSSINDDHGDTQFSRAMRELDIEMIFANSPQAKGRVERSNKTLQDRLVKELRLLGISSIEEANRYLPEFIKIFNSKFAVVPKSSINEHRPLLSEHNLDEILCLRESRILSKNLTAQYKQYTYQVNLEPRLEYTLRKAKINIYEDLNGKVVLKYKNRVLNYCTILKRPKSRVYDSKGVNARVEEIRSTKPSTLYLNY